MKYINKSEETIIVSWKTINPWKEIEIDNILRDERFELVKEEVKEEKTKKNK